MRAASPRACRLKSSLRPVMPFETKNCARSSIESTKMSRVTSSLLGEAFAGWSMNSARGKHRVAAVPTASIRACRGVCGPRLSRRHGGGQARTLCARVSGPAGAANDRSTSFGNDRLTGCCGAVGWATQRRFRVDRQGGLGHHAQGRDCARLRSLHPIRYSTIRTAHVDLDGLPISIARNSLLI